MADDAIEQAFRRLRIPTRRDIDRINERIDRLTAEVRRTNGRAGAHRPAKRR
jgi:hypothetical protein